MADEVQVSTMPSGAAALVIWPDGEEVFYREVEADPVEAAEMLGIELASDLEVPLVFHPPTLGGS